MSSTDAEDSFEVDFQILKTRSKSYSEQPTTPLSSNPLSSKSTPKKAPNRHNTLKCRDHEDNNKNTWTSVHSNCKQCIRFTTAANLKESVLPRTVDALNLLLTLKDSRKGYQYEVDVYFECARLLAEKWLSCNVYPMSLKSVKKRLVDLFDEYRAIKKYSKKSESYWQRCAPFLVKMSHLFDIQADESLQKSWYKKTMVKHDIEFYEAQVLNPPRGYSTSKTDKKWEKSTARKQQRNMQETPQPARECDSLVYDRKDVEDEAMDVDDDADENYVPPEPEEREERENYSFTKVLDDPKDDLPQRFRHIRDGLHGVNPSYYVAMNRMKAELHMSEEQAQGSVCIIFNEMLDRKKYGEWKRYKPKEVVDNNTLPAKNNTLRNETYIEAMILAGIVNEMMSPDAVNSAITLSNDGSAQSGVGNFIVQSFFINGKQRALPTLSIFTESRSNLSDMTQFILKMLSTASGFQYSEKQIMERVDFVVTDSTAHNMGVIDNVCDELETDSKPDSLVCHVHPLMMFQSKLKQVYLTC